MIENECEFCEYNENNYVEEYEHKVREIMVEAVNSKIKESLEDLAQLRVDFIKLKKDRDEAKRQIYKLNEEKEEEIKKVIKETELEVERRLGLDFTVGDTVYYAKSETSETKCPHCNKGKVVVNVLGIDKEVSCPFCDYGSIRTYSYIPKSDVIRSIKLYMTSPDSWIARPAIIRDGNTEYNLENKEYSLRRSSIYKTEQECQLACDEANRLEKEKEEKKQKGETK